MNQNHEQEIKALCDRLDIPAEKAQQLIADIDAGDALLDSFPPPPLSPRLIAQTQEALRRRLHQRQRRTWLLRIAAVLAFAFVAAAALLVGLRSAPTPRTPPVPTTAAADGERALWEFALNLGETRTDTVDHGMDAVTITDLLLLFEDARANADHSLGRKEPPHENYDLYINGNLYLRGTV